MDDNTYNQGNILKKQLKQNKKNMQKMRFWHENE